MRCVAEGVLLIFAALRPGLVQAAHQAPAEHKTNDLADVLLKAVELMDHGLVDFLKEQATVPKNQDTQMLLATENKAINVIHQISTNFHDLKEVVGKFKRRHQNELKGVQNKLVEQKEQDKKCLVDKADMQGRAEHCESVLQRLAPQGPGNETFSVTDWKELDAKASSRIKELQKENTELSGSVNELKLKAHDAERTKQDAETRAKQLEDEAASLRAQVAQLKNDETSMLKTMKTLVQKNKVKTMETQANSLKEAREGMQTEFEKKEQALQEREAELQKQLENAKAEASKKEKDNALIKKQMNKVQTNFNVLNADKVHLLGSLNSVLRQNNEFQQQIKLFSSGGCALKNSTGLPVPGNLDAVAESTGSMIMADQTASESDKKDDEKKDDVAAAGAELEKMSESLEKGGSSLLQQSIHPHVERAPYHTFSTAGDHHALNSWLSKPVEVLLQRQQVQTPMRKTFLPRNQDEDSDVLQQLALISTGWQNHRVKA
jgi:chromosome segregation ATPase